MTRQHLWSLLGEGAAVEEPATFLFCCFEHSRTSFLKLFHHFRVASAWWSYDLYTSPALFVAALVCQPQPESRNVMHWEHCVTPARELHMELDRLAYKSSSNFFTSLKCERLIFLKMFSAQKRKASWIDFLEVLRFSFPVPNAGLVTHHSLLQPGLQPRGRGVLPYITYMGMCRPKGSWFWSSWFRTGYPFQRRFLERGIIFRTHESSPLLLAAIWKYSRKKIRSMR